jgi:hypothetical protein
MVCSPGNPAGPLVITSPGTYSVTADGYDGNVTPIEIRSSNVVLDGGGIPAGTNPGTLYRTGLIDYYD